MSWSGSFPHGGSLDISGYIGPTGPAGPAASNARSVDLVLGDGVTEIADGIYVDFNLPVGGTFTRWRILATRFVGAATSGSLVVDLWATDLANFPPTVADSITTSKPTLTDDVSAEDTTITDWTETFSAGDVFRLNVDSCTDVALCLVSLWYEAAP